MDVFVIGLQEIVDLGAVSVLKVGPAAPLNSLTASVHIRPFAPLMPYRVCTLSPPSVAAAEKYLGPSAPSSSCRVIMEDV